MKVLVTGANRGIGREAAVQLSKGVVWAATLSQDGLTGGFFRDGQEIAW